MKATSLVKAIVTCINSNRPAFIHGSPGIGKSDLVRQVANFLKLDLIDVRAVLLDPIDLRGIPSVANGKTKWCVPDFLPSQGKGILFIDELNAAPPLVQAALYQLILDRKLGEYVLPDGWSIVAAGNLDSDKAVTHKMSTALKSRFIHLFLEVDVNEWVSWAIDNKLYMPLIAFIKFRPTLLHSFDPNSKDKAFPCPRTVSFVSDLYNSGIDADIEYELVSGTVGEGFAVEWISFHRIFKTLPNPDMVLMNPDSAPIPTDIATLWALCGAISRKVTENSMDRFVTYISRLSKEFNVFSMQNAVKRDSDLVNTNGYIRWASENQDVMF